MCVCVSLNPTCQSPVSCDLSSSAFKCAAWTCILSTMWFLWSKISTAEIYRPTFIYIFIYIFITVLITLYSAGHTTVYQQIIKIAKGGNVKNRECNMIYVAITVYAVIVSEVAAERSSVGCWGDALCTTPAGVEGTLSCRTGQRAKGGEGPGATGVDVSGADTLIGVRRRFSDCLTCRRAEREEWEETAAPWYQPLPPVALVTVIEEVRRRGKRRGQDRSPLRILLFLFF